MCCVALPCLFVICLTLLASFFLLVYISPYIAATAPQQFDPEKTLFKDISKINPVLLQDIVNCYKKSKYVCRTCFVRHHRQEIIPAGKQCRQCKNTAAIRVMPSSKMCQNFKDMKVLAIPSPPKVMMSPMNRNKPFQYCRNTDHTVCYEKSVAKESWYAHSIEELVIWTVERYWSEWMNIKRTNTCIYM